MVTRLLLALLLCSCTTEGDVLTSMKSGDGGGGFDGQDFPDADPANCQTDGPCPLPPIGRTTVCGRVIDLETSLRVPGSDGVAVRIFDPADLATDPLSATPLATVIPDECGWFRAENLGPQVQGFTILSVDDTSLAGAAFRRTGSVVQQEPGQVVRLNAFALRAGTDDAWAASAGLGGQTFESQGSLLVIFIDLTESPVGPFQGAPVGGVTLLRNGSSEPANDYYFTDADALSRTQVSATSAQTSANGSALFVDPPQLSTFEGQRPGCIFASLTNVISPPSVLLVQEVFGTCM